MFVHVAIIQAASGREQEAQAHVLAHGQWLRSLPGALRVDVARAAEGKLLGISMWTDHASFEAAMEVPKPGGRADPSVWAGPPTAYRADVLWSG